MTFSWSYTGGGSNGTDVAYKYTGKELDSSTGLYFYEARYYDAALGRFISADPIVTDPNNPQALNRYTYVLNNPLRYTDPSGHNSIEAGSGFFITDLGGGSYFSIAGDFGFGPILPLSNGLGTFSSGFSTLSFSTLTYTFDPLISLLISILPASKVEQFITEILPKFPDLYSVFFSASTDQPGQSTLPFVNSSGAGSSPILLASGPVKQHSFELTDVGSVNFFPGQTPNITFSINAYGVSLDTPVRALIQGGLPLELGRINGTSIQSLTSPNFFGGQILEPTTLERNGTLLQFKAQVDESSLYFRIAPIIGNPPTQVYGTPEFFTPEPGGCISCSEAPSGYVNSPLPPLQ